MSYDVTEDFSGNEHDAIISGQLEVLFKHCEERGVSRTEAEDKLLCMLQGALLRSFVHYMHGDKQAVLDSPGAAELTQAFELAMRRKENTAEFDQVCQSWLQARCGAKLGDVVRAHDWKQPREIMVQEVKLSWNHDAGIEQCMISLTGPTIHSKGVGILTNYIQIRAAVTKIEPPASLLRFCRKHDIQVESSS